MSIDHLPSELPPLAHRPTVRARLAASCGIVLLTMAGASWAGPADTFVDAARAGGVSFAGIDPSKIGDINAAPTTIAQVTDTDGTLGGITGDPFWTWVGKGLVVVGGTGTGALGGAAVGSAVPGLGTAAGAIIGGGAGAASSLGGVILANNPPPPPPPPAPPPPPKRRADAAVFDNLQYQLASAGGGMQTIDLGALIVGAVNADIDSTSLLLPGGGTLVMPSASLFAGSMMVHADNSLISGASVQVGVLKGSGFSDDVIVFFDNPGGPILATDKVKVDLDNIVNAAMAPDGTPIVSRSILAVAVVPEPASWLLMLAGLGTFGFVARRRG